MLTKARRDRSPVWRAGAGSILAACVAAACLPAGVDPAYEPMCFTSEDCDPGKSCDEGLCWGKPPARPFAAILVPPADGWPSLAPTEIPDLIIHADGWVQNLAFEDAAMVYGRVVLSCGAEPAPDCDDGVSIEAQVTVSQPSRIPGRPDYTRTVTSVAGARAGEPSFVLALPIADEPYQVTVVPARSSALPGMSPAELAPPLRSYLSVHRDMEMEWRMGDPDLHKVVVGRVVDAVGRGIPDMKVFARASTSTPTETERSSSIGITDPSGQFTLRIPLGLDPRFDLIAMPVQEGSMPTLQVSDVSIDDPVPGEPRSIELDQLLQMPGFRNPTPFTIPIRGMDRNGNVVRISGATIRVNLYLEGLTPNTTATFSTHTFTNDDGNAVLSLIPGDPVKNRTYVASVEPLPDTEHAVLYEHILDIGSDSGGVLETIFLGRRLAVGGAVYQADGEPAYQATVTARLSPAFRQQLSPQARAAVESLQLSSTRTDQSGRFVVWLDEALADVIALYDLEFTPANSLAPPWWLHGVDMRARSNAGTVELERVVLPRASYARGIVSTAGGAKVPQASVRLFEILDRPCAQGVCAPRSILRGHAMAREDGLVRLILPE